MTIGTPQQKALSLVRGKKLLLPNLYEALPGWRYETSRDCSERVNDAVEAWIQSWTTNESTHAKARAGKPGLLAKCMYPDADEEMIADMACYLAWIFEWDDNFDLTTDIHGPKRLQEETKRHIESILNKEPILAPGTLQPITNGLTRIVSKIANKCPLGPRKRFLHEIGEYIDSVTAWAERQNGSMPTLAEQCANRRLTVGVRPSIELIEYCYGLDIPQAIIEHDAVQEIMERTTEIVMLSNDIVSLGPEMASGQVGNIISVLAYQDGMSAQGAMDRAVDLIRKAHTAFEEAERCLPLPSGNTELDASVQRLVLGCKDICTGSINWSYNCSRYFGENPVRESGKVVIQL
ncbi:isoprenoid synthase domain-containing protein [Sphaerosporella brunnea]|uniref:Terpene synthase n=1 Tax=Sphaerosporella brunnea TaxID=1250544 RepID=A0A5J5EF70_9PEZI|nr:isoprenoid synthase domain-containing protein [Sphaerosporella brunnea]